MSLLNRSPYLLPVLVGFLGVGLLATSLAFYQPPVSQQPVAAAVKTYLNDDDWIRVGIAKTGLDNFDYDSIQLLGTGGLVLSAQPSPVAVVASPVAAAMSLGQVPANTVITIKRVDSQHFELSQVGQAPRLIEASAIRLAPVGQGFIALPEVKRHEKTPQYRGFFEVVSTPEKPYKLTAINVLLMKDYLSGVVPNELPLSFGQEAVKAQAVLARNYAINPREKPWKTFDICDTQYCQAYYGANTENATVTKLLAQTHGTVALYQGTPILALYSSTHGGVSEDYSNVFGLEDPAGMLKHPYLSGRSDIRMDRDLSLEDNARWYYTQTPQSYDVNSPLYRWSRTWPEKDFGENLLKNLASITDGKLSSTSIKRLVDKHPQNTASLPTYLKTATLPVGELLSVRPIKRGVSGKVLVLEIETTEGVWQVNKEYTIRKLFAQKGSPLPSANFVITHFVGKQLDGYYVLNGGGFGHGVGMSQYGAGWMAQHGKNYEDIIRHYYQNVSLGTIPISLQNAMQCGLDFVAPRPNARIYFKNRTGQATRILLNGKQLPPETLVSGSNVSTWLKPGDNRLELLSAGKSPTQSPVIVWLEF